MNKGFGNGMEVKLLQ